MTLGTCRSEWEKTAEHKLQPKFPIFQMKKKNPKTLDLEMEFYPSRQLVIINQYCPCFWATGPANSFPFCFDRHIKMTEHRQRYNFTKKNPKETYIDNMQHHSNQARPFTWNNTFTSSQVFPIFFPTAAKWQLLFSIQNKQVLIPKFHQPPVCTRI